MKLGRIAVLTTVFGGFLVASAAAEIQKFNYPKNGSYRLDWCLNTGTDCGAKAARKYCIKKGFDDQVGFKMDPDIGEDSPTRVLNSGFVCADAYCDGFKSITCDRADEEVVDEEPVFIDKVFAKPKVGGVRIHFCFKPGSGCGNKAANAFCDLSGYDQAISFAQAPILIGKKTPRYLGTGQLCIGLDCSGFTSITCRKEE